MRDTERGYALMLVIAVVAALSLAVLAAARTLSDVAASAARVRQSDEAAVATETLMTRTAYLLLTREPDGQAVAAGDSPRWQGQRLTLDGAPYAVAEFDDAFIAVQDEAGLFNLNGSDEQGLAALLSTSGVRDAEVLAARLMDYTDADDVVREGGAERRAYAQLNLLPPPDAILASRWQALEVLGWRERALDRTPIWSWLTASPSEIALNINTAPEPVLQALLGDQRLARAILVRRSSSPIVDTAEAEAMTAAAVRAEGVSFAVAAGRVFRVQAVFGSQTPYHGFERRLELGGAQASRPFRWIEEREVRSAPWRDDNGISRLSLEAAAS